MSCGSGAKINHQGTKRFALNGEIQLDAGFRLDLIVAGAVVVEVTAVERVQPVHRAQLLSYLKLSGHSLGFLINFNVPIIKLGIQRLRFGF